MRLRLLAALVGVTLLASGCAEPSDAAPTCDDEGVDAMILIAQSVPDARLVPCIEVLPERWTMGTFRVKDSGTQLTFDLDGFGRRALGVTFEERCTRPNAHELSSDEEGAQLFEQPDRFGDRYTANRYYVFDGGCATYDFDMPHDDTALAQILVALTFTPRNDVENAYNDFLGI